MGKKIFIKNSPLHIKQIFTVSNTQNILPISLFFLVFITTGKSNYKWRNIPITTIGVRQLIITKWVGTLFLKCPDKLSFPPRGNDVAKKKQKEKTFKIFTQLWNYLSTFWLPRSDSNSPLQLSHTSL